MPNRYVGIDSSNRYEQANKPQQDATQTLLDEINANRNETYRGSVFAVSSRYAGNYANSSIRTSRRYSGIRPKLEKSEIKKASDFESIDDYMNYLKAAKLDPNGDGHWSPIDALLIINSINRGSDAGGNSDFAIRLGQGIYDFNQDGKVDGTDAQHIINHLNKQSR